MKLTLSPNVIHHLFQHKIKLSVISLTYFPSLIPALQPCPPAKIIIKSYLKKPGCFFFKLLFMRFLSLQCTSFSPSSVGYILNSSCKTQLKYHLLWEALSKVCVSKAELTCQPPLSPLHTSVQHL